MAFPGLLAAFRRELLVLAVLALFRTAASVQDCIQNVGNTSSLPEAQYVRGSEVEAGGLSVLYHMVHGFLDIVQPNPFPTDIAKSLIGNIETIQNSYMKVVQYEVGYIVCAIIGILLLLLMPLIGLCFCCCRCCGRCGGKMYQQQTGSMDVRRRLLTVALFVVTSVILAGCACMFVSNAKTSETVQESEKLLSNTLENLKLYIITIPIQVTAITNSTSIPVRLVTANLDNIDSNLGESIKEKLGKDAYPALRAASNLAEDIQKMNDRLLLINSTTAKLIQQQEDLRRNLSVIQESINTTLRQCEANCTNSQGLVTGLTTGAKFSMIPNMDQVIIAMKKVVDSNFQSFVQEGYRAFNDTPAMVTNQSASTVSEVKKRLADIQTQVENIQEEFPILNTTGSITSEIDNINSTITKYYPQVKEANKYRWIVGIVLSCIVLLIVVCNCFGLLLGTACLKASVDPCQRNSASHAGGNFLMAGVGFSFIFFWLLILLVLILFLVGGNVYSLVCKPWYGGELFQVMEDVGMLDQINLGEALGLKDTSLNISTVYHDCQNNTSAWKALNLGLSFNLDDYLNISKYTGDISKQFEKLEVNLSGITLLDKEGKMIARDVLNTGVIGLNFTNFTQQLSLPLTQSGLLLTAQKLRNLSKIVLDPAKTEFNQQAGQLEQLDRWIKSDMMPNVNTLKEKSQDLQTTTSGLEEAVNTTLLNIENVQTLLQTQALDIIKNESKDFLDCQLSYFNQFVTWAKEMITQDVARCKPAANALDSVATISCSYLLDSLNAFWFCMGWCTIFLIPSIIFAVKLAKFFRCMATQDVYENGDLQLEMRRRNK
ncbi:prominin-1-A-like [Hemitrygon akajei]|uniref:prominin-1-A-like n=1 Tax=Hemitrygon akajei TaxID=2704970 RepID=UPI003BFA1E8D